MVGSGCFAYLLFCVENLGGDLRGEPSRIPLEPICIHMHATILVLHLYVELDRKKLPPEGGKIDAPPGLLDSNTLHEYR